MCKRRVTLSFLALPEKFEFVPFFVDIYSSYTRIALNFKREDTKNQHRSSRYVFQFTQNLVAEQVVVFLQLQQVFVFLHGPALFVAGLMDVNPRI